MSALSRFLGGSPLGVVIRLVLISLGVGWLLSYLDWTPGEVWNWIRDLVLAGWDSMGALGEYVLIGAAIVVPVFIVMRVLAYRGSRG